MSRYASDRRVQVGAGIAVLAIVIVLAVAPRLAVSAPPPPTPSPTATAQAGFWRIEGTVFDENKKPVAGVCVHVGPGPCVDVNPRTDAAGHWFLDVPQVSVDYDFHFTKAFACIQEDQRVRPTKSTSFEMNLRCILKPPSPSP